jgi:Glycosyl hydrolase family 9/Cellulase N-terminal ig-like domain
MILCRFRVQAAWIAGLFAVALTVNDAFAADTLRISAATALIQPAAGDHGLRVISPTLLELRQFSTKAPDPAPVTGWNLVDANGQFIAPALTRFAVTADGRTVSVVAVGFKRRPLSAPLLERDLRIDNALYLQLATPIADGQTVVVTNPDVHLWPATETFVVTTDPLRYSPAIHVNQEGYVPIFPKKAMIGYYLGSLGELPAAGLSAFRIVSVGSGATVFRGALSTRLDIGYDYPRLPYQNVMQADFSGLTAPGEYYLVVPGLGASLPFLINDGIAMGWMRTYALGLYERRSGVAVGLPFTRFSHDADHTAPAEVPSPQSAYAFTWKTIASKNTGANANPLQTAPALTSEASQLYPFVNKGTVDVSGGHFDAGDYSKYTIDCAALVHTLMFTVDSIPGAAALENLGIPESGDGIPDLLQEAKWEADTIAKLQDADGGFYFIVYPKNREYESNVSLTGGDDGDTQVVWPKNTSATAAAVAALAECASSPAFKKAYPATAALYLQKATLGWQFLMNAIAKYGKIGAYQKITFYGDDFTDNDEESWAACEMYLATGNPIYEQQLFAWFPNPSDPSTFRFSWVHMSESYGNAIRSYAFAARTGRLQPSQLARAYLDKCNVEIAAAGDDALLWSNQNAYATSFPREMKRFHAAGWYFSLNAASDLAVAYQLNPKPAYLDAIVGNLNYEGGTNPVNVTYITGLGQKRQHTVVDQYEANNRRALPPDGIPIGNIQDGFEYLPLYGGELREMTFPSDSATEAPYPFYDRWADTWNVTTEFVAVNQARSILALSVLVAQTAAKSTPWTSGVAQIVGPVAVVPVGAPTTLSVRTPGLSLANARIVWEARDQQPAFGSTFTLSPVHSGAQWVEVEVEWPDGRRVFSASSFTAQPADPASGLPAKLSTGARRGVLSMMP